MKNWIIPVKIAISVLILTFLAIRAVKENQFAALVDSPRYWPWLAAGVLACLAAHVVATYRWYLLSRSLALSLTFYDAMRIGLIGVFFGIVAFGVVGTDALRAYYVARQSPGRRTDAVATVFIDRVVGLLTMFLAAFLGLFFGALAAQQDSVTGTLAAIRYICWFAGGAFAAGLVGLVLALAAPSLKRFAWFHRMETFPLVGPLLRRLVRVMKLYRGQLGKLGIGFVLSAGVNLCYVAAIYFVARFVSIQHPTLGDHLTIAPISMVANAVPLPGGIGGMEAALDLLYQTYAKNLHQPQIGVVVAFVFRLLLLSVAALGAAAWFTLPARQREELRHARAPESPSSHENDPPHAVD